MKLNQFDTVTRSNIGVELELKDLRTGRGAGGFITVLGVDSDVFRAIKDERARDIAERIAAGSSPDLTFEQREAMTIDMLARVTVGWRSLEDEEGAVLVYSVGAARTLYTKYPAIREQVNVFVGERANFLNA